MTLQQLEYFQSCAVYRNFSRAAQYHFVSESTLSRQIASLEKEMHTSLFVREARGVTLTKAGMLLFRKSVEVLQQIGEFRRGLVEEGLAPEETSPFFRIATSVTDSLFPELATKVARIPPGTLTTQIKIDIVRAGAVPKAVIKGSDDVGIDLACNLSRHGGEIETAHFLYSPIRVFVGEKHELYNVRAISLRDFILKYRTWGSFVLPEVMGHMVFDHPIESIDDILQLRQVIARHLPYIEAERWAQAPDYRILIPDVGMMPSNYDDLHVVELVDVPISATEYVFFWRKENGGNINTRAFIEAMAEIK